MIMEGENNQRTRIRHRLDIQALRGISVIAVVLFHLGYFANSGFVGVDLFFVISGFVITALLYQEFSSDKQFKLRNFYIGRIYRLLPALGTMIFAISIMAFFLFSPLGMQQNSAKSGIGALLLSGNWVISEVTRNYFDLPAESNPFLNTWSLSVEEQFYLLFPMTLLMVITFLRRRNSHNLVTGIFLTLGIFSLFLYALPFEDSITGNYAWLGGFYSPFTRTWEFLAGVCSFLLMSQKVSIWRKSLRFHKFLSYVITFLILSCLFMPTETFQFPSLNLVLPILLIALLLSLNNHQNVVLNSRTLTYIGDRSYSIYLWHWPFIVIAKYIYPGNELMKVLLLLISILISIITYRYLENPIRKTFNKNSSHTIKLLSIFLVIPLFTASALGFVSSQILFQKYESGSFRANYVGDVGAIRFEDFKDIYPSPCPGKSLNIPSELKSCQVDILIIGDSHAAHLAPGFSKVLPEMGVVSIDPSVYTSENTNTRKNLLSAINENPAVDVVIFNSYWARNTVPSSLRYTINSLAAHGKRIIVLDDVPNFPFDAFACKYGRSIFLKNSICSHDSEHFFRQRAQYLPKLERAVSQADAAELIQTSSLYCAADSCSMLKNGNLHFLDLNHLNVLGSIFVAKYVISHSDWFYRASTSS